MHRGIDPRIIRFIKATLGWRRVIGVTRRETVWRREAITRPR
jgi:hypothetical protein